MERYAAVYFGPSEIDRQREFLQAMVGLKIIELSYNDIKRHMEDAEKEKAGIMNRLVLHSPEEEIRFKSFMRAFFPDTEFKITNNPDDEEFSKWLKKNRTAS